MTDKVVIYGRHGSEPHVPLTVRVEWCADGKIKPLMYWTPEGICFTIRDIYECTPLALIKERGFGLRFKITAETAKTAERYGDASRVRYETYLYLADSWFCGGSFIDGRYGHEAKEYIPVVLDVFPGGDYELICFTARGTRYVVDKTIAVEPRGSFQAGGIGVRHKVEAWPAAADHSEDPGPDKRITRMAALFFEINKWFVAVKV